MTCPQCSKNVPASSHWTSAGFAGIECPHCHAPLCPTPISAILLFLASFGLGDLTLLLLRRMGQHTWVSILACIAVFALGFIALAPLVIRLRVRERRAQPRLTDRKA